MGAPGLDFETWDPPRKCRQTNLGALTKSSSHAGSLASGSDSACPQGLKSLRENLQTQSRRDG